MRRIAIVTPVYREEILPEEAHAIRHLRRYLSKYDLYQVSPESLRFRLEGASLKRYSNSYFKSVATYSQLLLSKSFYQDFLDYDFLLIYQLDCLVFRDNLDWWSNQNFDYVGAPLFTKKHDPQSGFSGGCNGGLSLRRVAAFVNVLNSQRHLNATRSLIVDVIRRPLDVGSKSLLHRLRKKLQLIKQFLRGIENYTKTYTLNEDLFWSARARYFWPHFKVAPPQVALHFAFESAPAWCFEQTGKIPFGAHAWQKWDRDFWEPYLLKA